MLRKSLRRFCTWLGGARVAPVATSARLRRQCRPGLESLETRTVASVTVQFDYSMDAGGMFDNPAPRAILAEAARSVAGYLDTPLNAITFNNGRYALVNNPRTDQWERRDNVTIPAETLVVHIGGADLPNSLAEAVRDGFGQDYVSLMPYPRLEFAGWGGTITFDTRTNWHFGMEADVPAGTHDFYSVAVHELGHILGVGQSRSWANLISDGVFRGPRAMARYGAPVPVDGHADHFADGVQDRPSGRETAMDPNIVTGQRKHFTPLDFAVLADIGWEVTYDPAAQPHLPDVIHPLAINEDKFNHVVAGDFNRDGHDDLLFVDRVSGHNRWFFGRRDGSFYFSEDRIGRLGINGYDHLVAGDFNGDGYTDLLGHEKVSGANRWFINRGDATFTVGDDRIGRLGVNGNFDHVVTGDFNGDGRDDVLFHDFVTGQNRWFFARADGGLDFQQDIIGWGGMNGYHNLVAGDFNGDGRDDLLGHAIGSGANRWFIARPEGGFADGDNHIAYQGINGDYDQVVVGDFNGVDPDGKRRDDLLFHSTASGGNRWFFARPGGGFDYKGSPVNPLALDRVYRHLAAGDFNGDGAADAFFHVQSSGRNVMAPGIPPRPPTVTPSTSRPPAVIPSTSRLTGAHVGKTFTLTARFNKAMDTTVAPMCLFDVGGALRYVAGRWADATTYVSTFSVLRSNVDFPNVAVHVFGARDAAHIRQETTKVEAVFSIAMSGPRVLAITRLGGNRTAASAVRFKVTFSADVRGVDAGDFRLVATGTIRGARILRVQRLTGQTYTITVAPGRGRGQLRLDLLDNGTIVDLLQNPLGGRGPGSGNFRGQAYAIRR